MIAGFEESSVYVPVFCTRSITGKKDCSKEIAGGVFLRKAISSPEIPVLVSVSTFPLFDDEVQEERSRTIVKVRTSVGSWDDCGGRCLFAYLSHLDPQDFL